MTLSVTAAQRASTAYRAGLRAPIPRWHRERPARWATDDSRDWDALQVAADPEAATWAGRDDAYAAVTASQNGQSARPHNVLPNDGPLPWERPLARPLSNPDWPAVWECSAHRTSRTYFSRGGQPYHTCPFPACWEFERL